MSEIRSRTSAPGLLAGMVVHSIWHPFMISVRLTFLELSDPLFHNCCFSLAFGFGGVPAKTSTVDVLTVLNTWENSLAVHFILRRIFLLLLKAENNPN